MSDTSSSRTFHNPDPTKDDPVAAEWFTSANKIVFDILGGAETKAEARTSLNVYSKSEADGIDHGGLSGLSDDDHTQYLKEDGTRAMSGNLDMGTNAVTNVGNVDGRDVSADGTKLDGIESGATADQTDAEIEAAYNNQVSEASKAQAEDPSDATDYRWTPQRVHQAAQSAQAGTDSGTDAYTFDAGYDLATGDAFTIDIDSANTTSSPTLENTGGAPSSAQSIVDVDGNARIGMLQARPHRIKWDGTNYVVLDPNTLQTAPSSSDPSLAFDTWRTPNADRPTLLILDVNAITDGTTAGRIFLDVDESGGTTADYQLNAGFAHEPLPSNTQLRGATSAYIPAGGSYQINNDLDPTGGNSLNLIREFVL